MDLSYCETEYEKIIEGYIKKNGKPDRSFKKRGLGDGLFERHHIKSRTHGGSDKGGEDGNLVNVSPEEHDKIHAEFPQLTCKERCMDKAAKFIEQWNDTWDLTEDEEKYLYEWAGEVGAKSCEIFNRELCSAIMSGRL